MVSHLQLEDMVLNLMANLGTVHHLPLVDMGHHPTLVDMGHHPPLVDMGHHPLLVDMGHHPQADMGHNLQ